jgi:hypothetical protein
MSDVIVRMEHIREARLCASGARLFFQRHNLNWSLFLAEGIPAEELLATRDAQAERVVEIARG